MRAHSKSIRNAAQSSAVVLATLLLAAGCSSSGSKVAAKAGPTTTGAAATTTVPKLTSSDDLSDKLLTVDDIGAAWQAEGQPLIGPDEVNGGSSSSSNSKVNMTCDGRKVKSPSSSSNYHGVTAVDFSQDGDYPALYEEIDSDKPAKLSKDLAAFTAVYGNCDKALIEQGGQKSSAQIQQFAFPQTGADEQYAFQITVTEGGETVNIVELFMLEKATLIDLEYSSIEAPDNNTVANLADIALQKL